MVPFDLSPYRKAIEERICTFCLDHSHEGTCGRPADDPCALQSHLGDLVERVLSMRPSPDLNDYVTALRTDICPTCRQDEEGRCTLRELAECALDSYVIPVIDLIEEVARQEGHRR
jgi:hypothetical protein